MCLILAYFIHPSIKIYMIYSCEHMIYISGRQPMCALLKYLSLVSTWPVLARAGHGSSSVHLLCFIGQLQEEPGTQTSTGLRRAQGSVQTTMAGGWRRTSLPTGHNVWSPRATALSPARCGARHTSSPPPWRCPGSWSCKNNNIGDRWGLGAFYVHVHKNSFYRNKYATTGRPNLYHRSWNQGSAELL